MLWRAETRKNRLSSLDYSRSVNSPPCGLRPIDFTQGGEPVEPLRPAGAGLRSGLALSRPYGLSKSTGAEEPTCRRITTNARGS